MTDHLETGTSTEEAPPCKCYTPSQVKESGVYCKGSLYGFLNLLLVSEQLSLVSALQCLAGLVAEPRGDWRPQARLSGGCGRGLCPGWLCFGGLGVSSYSPLGCNGGTGKTSYVCTHSCFLSVGDTTRQVRNVYFHRLQGCPWCHGTASTATQSPRTDSCTDRTAHGWWLAAATFLAPTAHQAIRMMTSGQYLTPCSPWPCHSP